MLLNSSSHYKPAVQLWMVVVCVCTGISLQQNPERTQLQQCNAVKWIVKHKKQEELLDSRTCVFCRRIYESWVRDGKTPAFSGWMSFSERYMVPIWPLARQTAVLGVSLVTSCTHCLRFGLHTGKDTTTVVPGGCWLPLCWCRTFTISWQLFWFLANCQGCFHVCLQIVAKLAEWW